MSALPDTVILTVDNVVGKDDPIRTAAGVWEKPKKPAPRKAGAHL